MGLQGRYHECRAVASTHRDPPALDRATITAAFPLVEGRAGMNAVPSRKTTKDVVVCW